MEKIYILVWVNEEERFYYFINDFEESQFKYGYDDFYITVNKDGYIIEDTFNPTRKGNLFTDEYDIENWN